MSAAPCLSASGVIECAEWVVNGCAGWREGEGGGWRGTEGGRERERDMRPSPAPLHTLHGMSVPSLAVILPSAQKTHNVPPERASEE